MKRDVPTAMVVLTGFMGTGKSTVGRHLADRLGWSFLDTDREIEARHGPIPVIFSERGEPEFRRMERALAVEMSSRTELVVATGGGMLLSDDVRKRIARARVFCLTASIETILARVSSPAGVGDRPLLGGGEVRDRIVAMLEERTAAYERFEQVTTDGRRPEAIVDDLLERLARPSLDGRR